jgi:hypothetical protein
MSNLAAVATDIAGCIMVVSVGISLLTFLAAMVICQPEPYSTYEKVVDVILRIVTCTGVLSATFFYLMLGTSGG